MLQNYGSGALYTTGCSCRDIAMNKMNYSSIHRSKALPYNWELCFRVIVWVCSYNKSEYKLLIPIEDMLFVSILSIRRRKSDHKNKV